jgi:ABC-type transport system involved in multi-copper enzyme maturation permease subunit
VIWLTWRQHRFEGLGTALILVLVVGLVGGLALSAQPLLDHIKHICPSVDDSCGRSIFIFDNQYGLLLQALYLAYLVLPVLSGLFIGAPLLAREFEQGTEQLAWSQGITRFRWLVVKLSVLGGGTAIIAGILAVAGQIWSTMRPAISYSQWYSFDVQGPEFVAYAVFAFALGVAAGAAIGKSVPAMAAVLVGFVAVRAAIGLLARRNFLPPVETDVNGPLFNGQSQAWMLGSPHPVDLDGKSLGWDQFNQVIGSCITPEARKLGYEQMSACWREHGVKLVQSIQPADRFPLFQGIETAIFIVAAIALLGLAVWLVRRRA